MKEYKPSQAAKDKALQLLSLPSKYSPAQKAEIILHMLEQGYLEPLSKWQRFRNWIGNLWT